MGDHLAQPPSKAEGSFMLDQVPQGFIQPSVEYLQGQSFHNHLPCSLYAGHCKGGDA